MTTFLASWELPSTRGNAKVVWTCDKMTTMSGES